MDDGAQTGALLDQVVGPVASFTADGAYDQEGASAAVAERHPEAAIIVPPRSTAVPSEAAETAPTQRDRHLQFIAEHGRAVWQKASGYTKRARAEAAIGRFKQVIGDGLRSRTDERRAIEVDVAVHALNRMLEFGRPISVRIARPPNGAGVTAPAPLVHATTPRSGRTWREFRNSPSRPPPMDRGLLLLPFAGSCSQIRSHRACLSTRNVSC